MLKKIVLLFVSLFVLATAASTPIMAEEAMQEQGWQFSGSAYMWIAGIGGESATGGDIDTDFDTIIDNLDMTIMGTVGARKGKWSFLVDVIYMDLEDNDDAAIDRLLALDYIELKAWIVTPMAAYNVLDEGRLNLNILAGARYLWMEADAGLKTTLPSPLPNTSSSSSDDGSVWDGIVGASGDVKLNEHWSLPFYFDVGGGDTDLTWQAFMGATYKINDKWKVGLGYRYLAWDFDDNDKGGGTFNDLDISGPELGAIYMF